MLQSNEWEERLSQSTGRTYWYNPATSQSAWTLPEEGRSPASPRRSTRPSRRNVSMTNITRATEAALPNRKFLAHISSRSQSARDLRAQEEYVKDNDRNQEGQSAGRDAARAQRIRAATQRPISPSRTPTHGLSPLGSTLGSSLLR